MSRHHGVDDREAEAGPAGSPGSRAVAADEPVEQAGLQRGRYAGAVVGHRQLHVLRVRGGEPDGHRGPGRRVRPGVAQQVGDHLMEPVLVPAHQDRFPGQLQDPAVRRSRRARVAGRVDG